MTFSTDFVHVFVEVSSLFVFVTVFHLVVNFAYFVIFIYFIIHHLCLNFNITYTLIVSWKNIHTVYRWLTCSVNFRHGVLGCVTTNVFSWDPQISYGRNEKNYTTIYKEIYYFKAYAWTLFSHQNILKGNINTISCHLPSSRGCQT